VHVPANSGDDFNNAFELGYKFQKADSSKTYFLGLNGWGNNFSRNKYYDTTFKQYAFVNQFHRPLQVNDTILLRDDRIQNGGLGLRFGVSKTKAFGKIHLVLNNSLGLIMNQTSSAYGYRELVYDSSINLINYGNVLNASNTVQEEISTEYSFITQAKSELGVVFFAGDHWTLTPKGFVQLSMYNQTKLTGDIDFKESYSLEMVIGAAVELAYTF
jgi:hypothetical protein